MAIARRTSTVGGSSTSSASWSTTRPGAAVNGDVGYWCCDFTGGPGTVTPGTGWTRIGSYTSVMANPLIYVFRRVFDGTADDDPSLTTTTARPMAWVFVVYSGENQTTPEDGTAVYEESGATGFANPVVPMPTTTTPGAKIVAFEGVSATTAADFTAVSTMSLFTSTSGIQAIGVWDKTADVPGAQPDVTWTMPTARRHAWLAWPITPAPDSPGTLDTFGLEILPRTWF